MAQLEKLFSRYRRLVLLDTETTGLNYSRDEIIEFAAVVLEQRDGQAAVTAAKEALAALSLPAGEAEYEREKAVLTAAITRLSGTDQTLALSIFLLGKNYVAAGLAAGYSEDGVKKRIPKLLDRLAKEIEEVERNKKRTGNMNNF